MRVSATRAHLGSGVGSPQVAGFLTTAAPAAPAAPSGVPVDVVVPEPQSKATAAPELLTGGDIVDPLGHIVDPEPEDPGLAIPDPVDPLANESFQHAAEIPTVVTGNSSAAANPLDPEADELTADEVAGITENTSGILPQIVATQQVGVQDAGNPRAPTVVHEDPPNVNPGGSSVGAALPDEPPNVTPLGSVVAQYPVMSVPAGQAVRLVPSDETSAVASSTAYMM